MNQIEKIIDIATWNRKEHFEHFSAFDDPFFGVTVHVDCTRSYQEAKDKGVSFSLLLLHRIITAASKVEEFRYRIAGGGGEEHQLGLLHRRAEGDQLLVIEAEGQQPAGEQAAAPGRVRQQRRGGSAARKAMGEQQPAVPRQQRHAGGDSGGRVLDQCLHGGHKCS